MRIRLTALAVLALATVLSGGGCSDDGMADGRPTTEQMSLKFRNELGLPPARADCLAEAMAGSDLSDRTLRAVYNSSLESSGDPFGDADLGDEDDDVLESLSQELTSCFGGAPPP